MTDGEQTRAAAFRAVLRSSIAFFLLMIAAIVFGLSRGGGFVVPTLASPTPVLVTYAVGFAFPALTAFQLLVAWVCFSDQRYVWTSRLARAPWVHFAVFMALLASLLARRH